MEFRVSRKTIFDVTLACNSFIHTQFTANQLHSVLYILYETTTGFGLILWPSSGSYKFGRRVQRIWQRVIGNWQTIYIYIYINNVIITQ